tara:strand:+ start:413 stop:1111 length:699 start_codon:yes stop_codon:yes gene_type:complete
LISNKIILAIDFDDTLSKNNVAREILRKYLQNDYQNILNKYLDGHLSFREYQELCFLSSGLNLSEIIEEAKNTGIIRDGFLELLDLIHSFNGEVVIVSAGLQNYIKPVLQKSGLNDLEIFSVNIEQSKDSKIIFEYLYSPETCKGDWAICKCYVLQILRKRYNNNVHIIFAGDGSASDYCASLTADHIIATGRLVKMLDSNGYDYIKFDESFYEINKIVKELLISYRGKNID